MLSKTKTLVGVVLIHYLNGVRSGAFGMAVMVFQRSLLADVILDHLLIGLNGMQQ